MRQLIAVLRDLSKAVDMVNNARKLTNDAVGLERGARLSSQIITSELFDLAVFVVYQDCLVMFGRAAGLKHEPINGCPNQESPDESGHFHTWPGESDEGRHLTRIRPVAESREAEPLEQEDKTVLGSKKSPVVKQKVISISEDQYIFGAADII